MNNLLGYTQSGKEIREPAPGSIQTACTINCRACRKVIRSSGGPMNGAICIACHEKQQGKTLLKKIYSSEELSDLGRDVDEAFRPDFTPAAADIPKDEHGFHKGTFEVSIVWKPEQ